MLRKIFCIKFICVKLRAQIPLAQHFCGKHVPPILQAIKAAKTNNPVILLDEVDKIVSCVIFGLIRIGIVKGATLARIPSKSTFYGFQTCAKYETSRKASLK